MRTLIIALLLASPLFAAEKLQFANPVMPGDYPDPSVIRVGDEYWATATTSEWAPLFPILKSRDLVTWEHVGNIFEKRPDWSVGNYWAPEIAEHKGTYFIYYVGRKKGGPLSLAVATAPHPTGPWTDHGPMIGQEAGSIDAVPISDENGDRYLIWKEDGNSRKRPTPLWIQKLSDDGTKLVGEMKEIMRNDAVWERNLVEGPFVLRRNDWYYMFYSGNACCGRGCNYAPGRGAREESARAVGKISSTTRSSPATRSGSAPATAASSPISGPRLPALSRLPREDVYLRRAAGFAR